MPVFKVAEWGTTKHYIRADYPEDAISLARKAVNRWGGPDRPDPPLDATEMRPTTILEFDGKTRTVAELDRLHQGTAKYLCRHIP